MAGDEEFRMKLERLIGYAGMHGRDKHKDPDAWGPQVRAAHRDLVSYVESRLAPPPAPPKEAEGAAPCPECGKDLGVPGPPGFVGRIAAKTFCRHCGWGAAAPKPT